MAIDNNDFTHEFQIYSTDLNAGTMGTGKFLLFDNNINAVKVESIDNIKIGGGTNGKILATDGAGNLRWVSAASGGGASSYNDLTDLPALFSGDYNDLTNKPTLFTANQALNTGNSVSFNRLTVTGASGIEGGEIQLAKAPTSTLAGDVIIDVYDNKIRFFEGGGTGRGFYLDLTTGANNTNTNIMSDSFSGSYNDLTNKPTVATSAYIGTTEVAFNRASGALTLAGVSIDGNAATVSNGVYTSGSYANPAWITSLAYSKLTDAPSIFSGAYADLTGKPSLATVATSGSYSDLTNRPTIFSGDYADLANKPALFDGAYLSLTGLPNLAAVATSGSYNDLSNKPSIPSLTGYATESWVTSQGYGSGGGGTGAQGPAGSDGADGASAYEVAVANGFIGNQAAWLASLVGATGQNGTNGTNGNDGADGAPGQGVPTGGTVGQVLAKIDSTDYNTEWVTQTGGSGATALSGLSDVSLEGPIEGSVLTWNNSQNHWENRDIPVATQIANTNGDGATYSVSVGTDGVVTMNTARGGIEFGALPEPGGTTHFHIMKAPGQDGSSGMDLYFGDDYNYVLQRADSYGGSQAYGVEIGAKNLDGGTQQVWRFGTDGDLVLPAGKTIRDTSGVDLFADPSTGDPAYKGFKAHYGRMWGNDSGPINKIVIYKDTATPSSTIDASTNNDDFAVTGLSGSDVVVMLVAIGEDSNQTTTAELKTFAEYIIDNVILDGGVEGDINTAAAMKTAFYNNFSIFSATLTDLKTGFEFFSVNNQFNIDPAFATGKGATFNGISYNMSNDTLGEGSWGQAAGTHQVGDVFVIPGNTIQDANSNFLSTPANDVTITITTATDGYIGSFTVTGTLPRPAETWPSNSIGDGGDDEYDTGNYITTNLESNISYNSGNVVSGSSAFGGGDYVVTYQNSIFGVFAVNSAIDSIATDGSSGFDGNGQADTGSLYGAASGVSIGDFVFTGSTMTSPDDDLYIKAVDDLWLDALDDDVHIRANDDVRIKAGYNFDDDDAQAEWRFENSGVIFFPNGSEQSTAWTGNVDWDDVNNRPSIPADVSDLTDTTNLLSASVSSLVNGSKTVSLGTDGVLTLPEGSAINDAIEVVAVTLDQFTDGGFSGTQVFTKVSDTLYQVLPSGPTMELITGTWYLKIGVATYYNSVDRITWEVSAGALPAPVGTLTTVVGMKLTVDGYDWMFDDDGGLTLPAGGVISEGGGFTGAIKLTPAGGANEYQALVIYPTGTVDGDHIHLTAGGGTTDLYLGNDVHYVKIENGGNVVIQAFDSTGPGAKQWLFDKNGDLTLPGNLVIAGNTSVFGTNASLLQTTDDRPLLALSSGANGAVSSIWVEDVANVGTSNIAAVYANPTVGSGIVRIAVGQNGVGSGPNLWDFGTDGNLTLPAGGDILDSTGASVLGGGGTTLPANASGYLVNDGTGALSWAAGDGTFSGDYDDLTNKPDLTVYQTASTAFSGSYSDLTNKPTIPADVSDLTDTTSLLFSGAYADLSNAPTLFSGEYSALTGKPTLFDGDYNSLTNKPTYKETVSTGTGPGGNNQADSLVLAGLNPTENIPSTYGGDLILKGGYGGANNDLFGEVRIKSGTIGSNFEWHFTVDKKIKLPSGGDIVDSTGSSVLFSGSYSDLTNKPSLATVATSGDYDDLTDKPTLFDGDYNSLTNKPELFDGAYNSLTNKPTIPADVSDLTDTTGLLPAAQARYETKNADFTAEVFKTYWLNSGTTAKTVTLPASPTAGDWVKIYDGSLNWSTYNLTVNGNGNQIRVVNMASPPVSWGTPANSVTLSQSAISPNGPLGVIFNWDGTHWYTAA